ncbi:MAG: plastocyanin/azurin family copper-binding protein [Gemmatimonadales bacterium]
MRKLYFVAGLMALAACGGEKKAEDQQAAPAPAAQQAAPAPAATGATWDVDMNFDGKAGTFTPAAITIKAGDVVRFHNKTGMPHNVVFAADSIPAGAAAVLDAAMADKVASLTGPMLVEQDAIYTISFAGAPAGVYYYHCLPHVAFKMHGTITVQ